MTFLHQMIAVPEGKTLSDVLPRFLGLRMEVVNAQPVEVCAGCRKKFSLLRKRRKAVKMHPIGSKLPLVFVLHICGHCQALYQRDGTAREGLLASIQAHCEGVAATQ